MWSGLGRPCNRDRDSRQDRHRQGQCLSQATALLVRGKSSAEAKSAGDIMWVGDSFFMKDVLQTLWGARITWMSGTSQLRTATPLSPLFPHPRRSDLGAIAGAFSRQVLFTVPFSLNVLLLAIDRFARNVFGLCGGGNRGVLPCCATWLVRLRYPNPSSEPYKNNTPFPDSWRS